MPTIADVCEVLVPGVDRISEAAVLPQLLEQPRRRSASDHAWRITDSAGIRGSPAGRPRSAEAPVRLLERAAVIAHAAGECRRSDLRRGAGFHVAEQPLGQREQLAVLDLAARDEDQARRNELLRRSNRGSRPVSPREPWPRCRAPSGRSAGLERGLEQMIVDKVVGRVPSSRQLGQDHLLLALEMLLVEMRGPDEVRDQLGDQRQVAAPEGGRGTPSGRARSTH